MKSFLTTMRSGVVAAMMLAGASQTALAQDISESHLQAARDAITAINATEAFDTILPDAAENLSISLISNNPDLETEIGDFVAEEAIKLASRRADLENEAALIYARAFLEEDLRAIAEFYNTDAGRALLENGPLVSRLTGRAAVVWRSGIERDLQQAVNNRLREANLRANIQEVPAEQAPAEAPAAQ